MRSYKVIYDLLDDMRAAMEGKLAALEQRVPLGEAEVRAVFGRGSRLVAGCMVTEGVLRAECFLVVCSTIFLCSLCSMRTCMYSCRPCTCAVQFQKSDTSRFVALCDSDSLCEGHDFHVCMSTDVN